MKALFRYRYQAQQAARNLDGYCYESTAEADTLDAQEPELQNATGEVSCLRSSAGDILAWWEESPIIYYGADEDGGMTDPTLDKSKLTKEGYLEDEIIEVPDTDPCYFELIKLI
jgi:hypothetical protein